ncbi:MAG: S-methyl-5'-thioadenosine phosphorylase [Armatimonadetes bacterium]|nr:S-methyl-5'-thioadenosine phosphorylase [Armatimonadota bacterium]
MREAQIGVFGGSGFYAFLENVEEVKVETPYGPPSDKVALANALGKTVAFLPRHARDHSIPPHRIPFRANLWAMKSLGVTRIISPSAAGSLQPHVQRGDFVVCDQFVDRTWGRGDTFFDGPVTAHIAAHDPYCPHLRRLAYEIGQAQGNRMHPKGTAVVIQGPRFSTRSESRWYTQMGWEVVNMTQYPEVILARELGVCYTNISLITDYDVGLADNPDIAPVEIDEVIRILNDNNDRVRRLILEIIARVPAERTECECAMAPSRARLE